MKNYELLEKRIEIVEKWIADHGEATKKINNNMQKSVKELDQIITRFLESITEVVDSNNLKITGSLKKLRGFQDDMNAQIKDLSAYQELVK